MNRRLKSLNDELNIQSTAFKVDSEAVKKRVNKSLNADLRERKLYMKNKLIKGAAAAAALTALFSVTAFAMSPAGQETINSIISYFQNDKANVLTDIEELQRYNEEIGQSVTKDGYTLTLDNVAADDNFIHVFYTIKSQSEPFYEGDSIEAAIYSDAVGRQMSVECIIDGSLASCRNHNSSDGYFVDNYTYKAMEKYNIAASNISDNFRVELFGDILRKDEDTVLNKIYKDDGYKSLTDEDKASIWYISVNADKSKVKVESVTKEVNKKLPWLNSAELKKVVFSPFGNQMVITTEKGTPENEVFSTDHFALYDENGKSLDILNTDLSSNVDGSSCNSYEFMKAGKDTKELKLVPWTPVDHGDANVIEKPLGQYPVTYEVSDYGKVVVTDVRISDGEIDIDYYKDGFVPYDPGFVLLDKNGNNAEPGGKLGCTLYHDVHYDTNSYTARYVYEKYDEHGKLIPMSEAESKESLKEIISTIGVVESRWFVLDFDKALTVNLK